MDERIARLKTSQEAHQVAENARLKGLFDLQAEALEHAKTLQAKEEGYMTPAEIAIATALYTYEEEQSRLKKKANFRAHRLRGMLKRHGALKTAERKALDRESSTGFAVLEEAGKQDLTFEAIIVRYPDEFTEEAFAAAQARLKGEPPPRRIRNKTPQAPELGSANDVVPPSAKLDGEAKVFWTGFQEPTNRFMADWLPKYKESARKIEQWLSLNRWDELFDAIWRTQNNHIAHAGSGILEFKVIDEMREELIQVIRDIYMDNSADSFENIVKRFESWKADERISRLPRLLVARAFAGIHPNYYHTTVDIDSQDEAIQWFVEHTGFAEPQSKSWADRALALTAHMSQIGEFGEDIFIRNMFPWFVTEQVRAQNISGSFKPGHRARVPSATSDMPEYRRKIDLRHNRVQDELYRQLVEQYGEEKVRTELPTGTGGYADAVVKLSEDEFHLYEIKIADTAAEVVRQAMGQLLEYGFRKGGLNPVKLFAVGEPVLDEVTAEFIQRLRREFNLYLNYFRIALE